MCSPRASSQARAVEQVRRAQEAGHLDPAWDPRDVITFVSQLATSWAGQPDLGAALPPKERVAYVAERRAAIVAAVQRIFPAM
nr:hypothetical protein [Streptomyces sp. FH025]